MTLIAFDLETHLIRPGVLAPKPVSVSLTVGGETRLMLWDEWRAQGFAPGAHFIGANIAFDMACICEHAPELAPHVWQLYADNRVHDIAIAMRMRDIANRGWCDKTYSLGAIVERELGRTLDKGDDGWRLRYSELDGVPIDQWPERARRYAEDDTRVLFDLLPLCPLAGVPDEPFQTRKAFWLHLTSCWGLLTYRPRVEAFERELTEEYDRLTSTLIGQGLMRPGRRTKPSAKNPSGTDVPPSRDTKRAAALVERALGDATPRTPTGQVQLSEEACLAAEAQARQLGGLTEDEIAALHAYGAFGSVGKQISSDLPIARKPIVQAHWKVPLETGRVSATDGVLTMNRDGKLRSCFRPPSGWCYIDSDYSGLESATFAQVLLYMVGRSELARAINEGIDTHSNLACQLCGESYGDFLTRLKAGDKQAKSLRQFAKIGNFGFPGGLGHTGFVDYARANGVFISERQSKELRERWLATWPEAVEYFRILRGMLRDVGLPPMKNGRADLRIPALQHFSAPGHATFTRANVRYTEACNSLFQHLGSALTGDCGFAISRECHDIQSSPLFGCRPVLYVHDQYLIEAPIERAPEAAARVQELMREYGRKWLPGVKLDAEPCLSAYFDKGAKAVYDTNGRLAVYSGEML
jgi:DNA polymerase-1